MRPIWGLLDPANLNDTFPDWLAAAVPVVRSQRAVSARTAAAYLQADKVTQLGVTAHVSPVLAESVDVRRLTTSLLVTGPLSIKRAMTRGVQLDRAAATAEASSAAAAMRESLDGGRDTIMQTVRADRDATGWERVASGSACPFCEELDGKFHRDDTADFPAHDGCACSQAPVYR